MGKIKVFIEDGTFPSVMASDGMEPFEIEIIDYDHDASSKELLEKRYAEPGFHDIDFSVDHCTEK